MAVERLAKGEGGRALLPVTGADIVGHQVAGDHGTCVRGLDVAATLADDHSQLDFIIQLLDRRGELDRIVGAAQARHLFVEPQLAGRNRNASDPCLLGMGLVVEANRQILLRVVDRIFQAYRCQ